jgi:hypothetical protein
MFNVRVRERDVNLHSVRVVAITHVLQPSHCSTLYTIFPLTFRNRRGNVRINVIWRSVSVTIVTVEKE